MYTVALVQEERYIDIGIFDTLENVFTFLNAIPNFYIETDGNFKYYYISEITDFFQYIKYKNKLIPLTKYSFDPQHKIEVIIKELPFLEDDVNQIINGYTLVDAYAIDNQKVKEYIELREEKYNLYKQILTEMGYKVSRSYRYSQDGEALILNDKIFFSHLDPIFTYDLPADKEEILKYLKKVL